MNSLGNAFVACGVIYTINSYSGRSTTINFAYDTKTGKQWNPNIQFTNQFGYNSMVDYNPREKVLYAWDSQRLVTYPITFEEQWSSSNDNQLVMGNKMLIMNSLLFVMLKIKD